MAYVNPVPSVEDVIEKPELESDGNEYNENNSVYFAFLDVLGFKQFFDDNKQDEDYNSVKKFEEVFTYYFDLMNSANFIMKSQGNLCYAGQTSDSLYFYTNREDYLIEFLKIFSHLSIFAMTKDVFFRGGVAKGNLYYKKEFQFYGKSVIYAYLLESEISKNPVIIIDENTYEAIKNIPDTEKLVFLEKSRHFIKPFAYLENEFNLDIDPIKIKQIDKDLIQKVIEQNKSKFEYDSRNFDKYVFLQNKLPNMNKQA